MTKTPSEVLRLIDPCAFTDGPAKGQNTVRLSGKLGIWPIERVETMTLREDLISTLSMAAFAWEEQPMHSDNRTRQEVAVDALIEWLRENKTNLWPGYQGGMPPGYVVGTMLADLLEE